MDDKERVQSFSDMVEASQKIALPWRRLCVWLVCALVVITVVLSSVIFYLVHCAYFDPIEFEQEQDFTQQTQVQTYSDGVTNGK